MTLDLVVSIEKESREIIKEVNEKRGRVEEVPVLRKGVRKALKMRRWREKDKFKYLKKNKSRKGEREKRASKRENEKEEWRKRVRVSLNQLMEQAEMECNSALRFFLIMFPVFPAR